jgi:hypothetical protein
VSEYSLTFLSVIIITATNLFAKQKLDFNGYGLFEYQYPVMVSSDKYGRKQSVWFYIY